MNRTRTESLIRTLVRESIETAYWKPASKRPLTQRDYAAVAKTYAGALRRGESQQEMVDTFAQEVDEKTLTSFAGAKRNPAMLKAFEDSLALTGEFDVSPEKAWTEAWRVANLAGSHEAFVVEGDED